MTKLKRGVLFQQMVNDDDQWYRLLNNDGLTVVDVYSEWCGHCASMNPTLRRIKNELIGHTFHLALAKSDNITCLKQFQDKSEPTWLFIIEGVIVNVMYGANAPKLVRLINEELNRVKSGIDERIELDINNLPKQEESVTEITVEIPPEDKKLNMMETDEEYNYFPF